MKQKTIISCYYGTDNDAVLPIGFNWAKTLEQLYKCKYKITMLLHGACLKYGLNSENNPYVEFLKSMHKKNIKIVICEHCLVENGYNNKDLLKFIKPIKFSVAYLADAQHKGKSVIFDALNN